MMGYKNFLLLLSAAYLHYYVTANPLINTTVDISYYPGIRSIVRGQSLKFRYVLCCIFVLVGECVYMRGRVKYTCIKIIWSFIAALYIVFLIHLMVKKPHECTFTGLTRLSEAYAPRLLVFGI